MNTKQRDNEKTNKKAKKKQDESTLTMKNSK